MPWQLWIWPGSCSAPYQKDHGLTVDGIAGRNTFMSLIA
ncbi:MAG: peptidoglycan-binding domain-containing protein [Blautia marasmi]